MTTSRTLSGGRKKKGNGHKMNCGCPICKNMRKSKKRGGADDIDNEIVDDVVAAEVADDVVAAEVADDVVADEVAEDEMADDDLFDIEGGRRRRKHKKSSRKTRRNKKSKKSRKSRKSRKRSR